MKAAVCAIPLFFIGFSSVALGDSEAPVLTAHRTSALPSISLPGRVKNRFTPGRVAATRLQKVRNTTHPALRLGRFVPGDILELRGRDLGTADSGMTVELVAKAPGQTVTLEVVSWSEKVVRVRLPDVRGLGVDAKEEAALDNQLRKNIGEAGIDGEVGLRKDGQWAGGSRTIHISIVGDDIDGDGHAAAPWGDDCDDFDPRRSPSRKEVNDDEQLDEDCNPDTVIQEELDLDSLL